MKFDFEVIKRYLEGNIKEGDIEKIIEWFSDPQIESDLREQYHKYWNELTILQEPKDYDGSVILDKIYHKIKLEESMIIQRPKKFSVFINILSRVAAILFIPLLTFLIISRNNLTPAENRTAYSEIYSPLGTRTMFNLPDGTKGWLNGGSFLEFPAKFKGKSREVLLKGEAYFEVQHDTKRSFIVSGDNFKVVAYGTSFNILAYPDDQIVNVTLVSGNITVSAIQNGKIQDLGQIKPNQMCTYDLIKKSYKIESVDINNVISWKEGRLVFRNDPFKDVVRKINRWYNVNMTIQDEILETYIYMATFEDETLEEVLNLLKLSAPIEYKDLGRKKNNDGTFEKRIIELYYKPK